MTRSTSELPLAILSRMPGSALRFADISCHRLDPTQIPIWLSAVVLSCPTPSQFGWHSMNGAVAKRSKDGKGHGWIWQMVALYGPRRKFNQAVVAFILLAILSSISFLYLDRVMKSDLQSD